ncbi:unnamed protein product [Ambrosiozyma monospora]|uniref:ubiquitinyl hydrolase 1 n=1 Tax=Ambrosiozyma monospora TaxID=43982 RepID=A0A9W6Z8R8_AMBMO|nr:unnamed protein product [Ambrosiozyma monospora]
MLKENIVKYKEKNANGKMEKLIELTSKRVEEIEEELAKPIINDDAYERLHTKNKVQKSRKTKQAFFGRPPALLCIHINRSVFDPRTYTVRKNNAKLVFPMKLNLTDYVAESTDINTDARLAFRKQDEAKMKVEKERQDAVTAAAQAQVEQMMKEQELEDSNEANYSKQQVDDLTSETDNESHPDGVSASSTTNAVTDTASSFMSVEMNKSKQVDTNASSIVINDKLTYSLKSAISHFGTHNYGHYIAFRKYRNTWWRISDETVRLSSEEEVLGSQGTFMLFYELSERNDPKDEGILNYDAFSSSSSSSDSEDENNMESESEGGVKLPVDEAKNKEDVDPASEDSKTDALEEELRQEQLIGVQANL